MRKVYIRFKEGQLIGQTQSIPQQQQLQSEAEPILDNLFFVLQAYYYSMNNHTFNYVYPPDFSKAQKHRLANRIFKGNLEQNNEECECCGKRVGQQIVETPCNIDPSQLSFLGPGIPLFFLFLKFIIFLLLVMTVFFMGFAIYSNVTSNDCGTISSCIPDLFNSLSLINKQSKSGYMEVQSYLGLAFVVVCLLFFHYFRYKARQLMQECDQVVDSPSDYAIILRRLPKGVTEAEIRELIEEKKKELTAEELASTCELKVNKIVLSYSLKEYTAVQRRNMDNFKNSVKEDKFDEFKCEDLPKPTETSQIAVVVFESQAAKDFFIHQPTTTQKILQFFCTPCIPLSECQIRGQKIGIQRAPQPDEIYWQNSGITMNGAIARKTMTGAVSIFILLIGGGTQYGLSLLASSSPNSTVLDTASSLIVTVFNVVLMLTLSYLTKKERNQTETQDQTVLMVKVTIFQFLNAGIFVIIAQIAANYSTFNLNKGIISQITLIMTLNAIVPNVTLLFLEYTEIINKIFRYLVEKRWLVYSQIQLNQIFIGSAIQLPNKYAYILKTLWLTALYSPLIPIVIGISTIGLVLFYFVEKFLYTRSYCMPSNVSSMSFECAVELLQYFLITFAVGQLIIYYYFYNFQYENVPVTWTATILATVSLAILNSVLPMEAINKSLFSISSSSKSELTYRQIQQKLEVTYEMTNPAYESKRKRNFLKNYHSVPSKKDSKAAAIEMTNMLHDSNQKNNESIISQKPLLNDFIERQSEEERKAEGRAIRQQNKYDNKKKIQKNGQKYNIEQKTNNQKVGSKAEKEKQKQKEVKDIQDVKGAKYDKTEKTIKKKDKQIQKKQQNKHQENEEGQQQMTQKEEEQQKLQQINHAPKPRKYLPRQPIVQKKTFEIVDPFQDLSSFKPPRFIIKLREQEAELQRLRLIKQQQQKKKAEQHVVQSKRLPKLSDPSTIRPPLLSPTGTLQQNLENVYANILSQPQGKGPADPTKREMMQNPVHLSVENVPIDSKYHQTGGKHNIYAEFIDPKHKPNISQSIRRPITRKPAKSKQKQKEKQKQQEQKRIIPTPRQEASARNKDSKFKFVVVNQVPIKHLKKNPKFMQESSMPDDKNEILGLANIEKRTTQSTKPLRIDDQDVNQAYKDAFGKSSNMNSRSSLHNDPQLKKSKEQMKQKRAIYNPISIEGSYKKYFQEKFDSDHEDNIQGFLNKKVVMSYIGTPFVNLTKSMEQLESK